MTLFLSGGAKSGKSSLAQELAVKLAGDGKRYYVATLIPSGKEDQERIRLHLEDRDGMGFETVECFCDAMDCLAIADADATFLVDSVTSLLQNALFPVEKGYTMDLTGAQRCGESLLRFADCVRNAVFVSDNIYCDASFYSETTESYRRCLASIDRQLAARCDAVIEVVSGQPIFHKGEMEL